MSLLPRKRPYPYHDEMDPATPSPTDGSTQSTANNPEPSAPSSTQPEQRPLPSSPRPRRRELPVPNSASHARPSQPPAPPWYATCNHMTMARIYNGMYHCDHCKRPGHFGWLYRCTVERDPLILKAKTKGFPVSFDETGSFFADSMTLGKFGPDARSNKDNLLKEMTKEQAGSYTQEQLEVLLAQREQVHKTIADERNKPSRPFLHPRQIYPDDNTPWMPDEGYECQKKICHRCCRLGKDKSWVSLDSVLEGDILPNVAVGYSFSYMGVRPSLDADMVQNIGYRAVPLPRNHPARARPQPSGKLSTSTNFDETTATPTVTSTTEGQRPVFNGFNIHPLPRLPIPTKPNGRGSSTTPRIMPSQSEETAAIDLPLDVRASNYTFTTPNPDGDHEERSPVEHVPIDGLDAVVLTEGAVESGTSDVVVANLTPAP